MCLSRLSDVFILGLTFQQDNVGTYAVNKVRK